MGHSYVYGTRYASTVLLVPKLAYANLRTNKDARGVRLDAGVARGAFVNVDQIRLASR